MTNHENTLNFQQLEEATKQLQQLGCKKINFYFSGGLFSINVKVPGKRKIYDTGSSFRQAYTKIRKRINSIELFINSIIVKLSSFW